MMKRFLIALLLSVVVPSAQAAVQVFSCEPEWTALAEEIGGDLLAITTATTALQDPHHIQARPSLIARLRRADLLVCTGAGLEVGWLPLLLRRAANPRVQPGQPGYLEATSAVALLERPARLDRAAGDIHAAGNPHIQTDPHNMVPVARQLAARLSEIDPAHAGDYRSRLADFLQRWNRALARWQSRAAPLQGLPVVVHHQNWVYLNRWLGLKQVATLEPKPGIPPSGADLAALLQRLEQRPARAVLRAAYQDDRAARWLSERAGIPEVVLPFTVGGTPGAGDLFGLYEDTLDRLLEVAQ